MRELIENISIRGRVAFIILCIENVLKCQNHFTKWNKVLEIFWSQTNSDFVDEWLYKISKVMPESILEDEYVENDVISFIEYSELKVLYDSSPKYLFELMECAFECGTKALYGTVHNNSDETILPVLMCVDIMNRENIELPNIELLKKFNSNENFGWGIQFTKVDIYNQDI